jgi:hypothetical protein
MVAKGDGDGRNVDAGGKKASRVIVASSPLVLALVGGRGQQAERRDPTDWVNTDSSPNPGIQTIPAWSSAMTGSPSPKTRHFTGSPCD